MRDTFLVPGTVGVAMKAKGTFYLEEGMNVIAVVHLDDVVGLFVLLVGEARKEGGGRADWGKEVCSSSLSF